LGIALYAASCGESKPAVIEKLWSGNLDEVQRIARDLQKTSG